MTEQLRNDTSPVGETPFSKRGKPVILMCSPNYFNVTYAINPWMDPTVPCDIELAKKQWEELYNAVLSSGADIEILKPQPNLPDMVFTANAAFVYNNNAVIAHYKHPERQAEEPFAAEWFKSQGFSVTTLPETIYFEGSGDALIWDTHIFAGHKARSSIEAHAYLKEASGLTVHPIQLDDQRYYHVDVCLCPLDTGDFIYAPDVFNEKTRIQIESVVPESKRIVVSAEEAAQFACNAISVNERVILNSGAPRLTETLKAKGYHPIEVNLSEFIKAGGSAKCLSLRLA
ncbi:MAG: arginine deiminase-related protein [Cyanobacteria bacterium P01_H01_bin.74]